MDVFVRPDRAVISTQSSNIHTPFLFHWPLPGDPQIHIFVVKLLSVIPISLTLLFIRLLVFVPSRSCVFQCK